MARCFGVLGIMQWLGLGLALFDSVGITLIGSVEGRRLRRAPSFQGFLTLEGVVGDLLSRSLCRNTSARLLMRRHLDLIRHSM